MLATLIAFAAEAADKPSKVPFYIFGGLLAVWAVVVSSIGIRAHDTFPSSLSARRGVMAISVVLVLCAMGSAVLTS